MKKLESNNDQYFLPVSFDFTSNKKGPLEEEIQVLNSIIMNKLFCSEFYTAKIYIPSTFLLRLEGVHVHLI